MSQRTDNISNYYSDSKFFDIVINILKNSNVVVNEEILTYFYSFIHTCVYADVPKY